MMRISLYTPLLALLLVAVPRAHGTTDDYQEGLDECQSVPVVPPPPVTGTVIVVGAQSPALPSPDLKSVFFQRFISGGAEHEGTVQVPVRLNRPLDVPLDVTFEVLDLTATQGSDHALSNGVVSFASNEIRAFIDVPLLDDASAEGTNEAFRIALTGVSSNNLASVTTPSTHTFYILENEHTPVHYYVDPGNGDDQLNDGLSPAQAFQTIQHAADLALAGDTIELADGVYREEVDLTSKGGFLRTNHMSWLTICAGSNASPVLKGSDVVTNWLHSSGAIWYTTNGIAFPPQLVFANGRPLTMVGWPNATFAAFPVRYKNPKRYCTGPEDMTPGTFFFDETNALYVWLADNSSPTQAIVEVAQRHAIIKRGISYVRLKGLAFRHNNSVTFTQQGQGAVVLPRFSLIEDCDIQWADFSGLDLDSNSRALRCNLSNNGSSGAGWNQTTNVLLSQCMILSNNWRRFSKDWHSGGIKTIPDAGGIVEYCEVAYNGGSGIWFDACDSGAPIVIRNNYIHHNRGFSSSINPTNGTGVGILIEISTDATIYNNVLVSNYSSAVRIHTSSRCSIFNNTMAWTPVTDSPNSAVLNLFQEPGGGGLPRFPYYLEDIEVFNNVIYDGDARIAIAVNTHDTNFVGDIRIDHNLYYDASLPFVFQLEGVMQTDLASWQAATGMSGSGLATNPLFSIEASNNYLPSAASPLIDSGTNVVTVTTDHVGTSRPQGAAYDIGAYERP